MSSPSPSSDAEAKFGPISPNTRAVLVKLLSTDFVGSPTLRKQLNDLLCRPIDKGGSLKLKVSSSVPKATVEERVPVEGEIEDVDGVMIHVSIHVVDGYLHELEVYREDPKPPIRGLVPEDMRVLFLTPQGWEIDRD